METTAKLMHRRGTNTGTHTELKTIDANFQACLTGFHKAMHEYNLANSRALKRIHEDKIQTDLAAATSNIMRVIEQEYADGKIIVPTMDEVYTYFTDKARLVQEEIEEQRRIKRINARAKQMHQDLVLSKNPVQDVSTHFELHELIANEVNKQLKKHNITCTKAPGKRERSPEKIGSISEGPGKGKAKRSRKQRWRQKIRSNKRKQKLRSHLIQ